MCVAKLTYLEKVERLTVWNKEPTSYWNLKALILFPVYIHQASCLCLSLCFPDTIIGHQAPRRLTKSYGCYDYESREHSTPKSAPPDHSLSYEATAMGARWRSVQLQLALCSCSAIRMPQEPPRSHDRVACPRRCLQLVAVLLVRAAQRKSSCRRDNWFHSKRREDPVPFLCPKPSSTRVESSRSERQHRERERERGVV